MSAGKSNQTERSKPFLDLVFFAETLKRLKYILQIINCKRYDGWGICRKLWIPERVNSRCRVEFFDILWANRCTPSWTACKVHVSREINGTRPDRFAGQSSLYWYEKRPPLSLTSSAIFKSDTFKFLNWNPPYLRWKGLLLYFLSGANGFPITFTAYTDRLHVCAYYIFPLIVISLVMQLKSLLPFVGENRTTRKS